MTRVAIPRPAGVARQLWVRALQEYFFLSAQPLTSLLFLAIPLVLYEVGTRLLSPAGEAQTETRVLAFSYLRDFLGLFGASGQYLPALTVVVILVAWHMARRDPWRLHVGTALGMAGESLLMAVPLLLVSLGLGRYLSLLAVDGAVSRGIVLAFGAGIYEELVFRLMGLTLLNIVLVDLLRMPQRPALLIMVLTSSILFSAYHYWGPVAGAFRWSDCVFRTLSGIYFAVLFMHRGFGITAGAHMAYDSYCFLLRALSAF